MVMLPSFYFEMQVLICQRPAYQKLSRVIRPSVAIAMRRHTKAASLDDSSRLNEKQGAWIERSRHCWKLYRSLTRAWDLVSRIRSWNVAAS